MFIVLWITAFATLFSEAVVLILPFFVSPIALTFFSSGLVALVTYGTFVFAAAVAFASAAVQYLIFADATSRTWATLFSVAIGSAVIVAIFPDPNHTKRTRQTDEPKQTTLTLSYNGAKITA